ncbi:hypothetical protein Vretimale_1031 [Volvox reticuliferus]|uniref:Uncharacterized protein n=1 Tax=Volvox reticuliferus TaxID=1737510 RepID=A0A8J4G345_9CHLO|nr:hypothetical protein Vretifemale_10443 [Volvox reticuliferus]GIL94921.1 hypothetical protein Vretimale_1031 [Volvox reticuliferus]
MLRNAAFETELLVPLCGRLPTTTISECGEGDCSNFESSETDGAGEQPSFERPAYSSFTSQHDDSSRGELNACGNKGNEMFGGGSAFANTTGTLSDDSDDERNARIAQPTRPQHLQQYSQPLYERNSIQELLSILMAPSGGGNQLTVRPSIAGNAVDGTRGDHLANSSNQQQQYSAEEPILQNIDSNNLPDLQGLLQTLGSRSRPYGVGLVPAEVIRAQLIFSALAAQTRPEDIGDENGVNGRSAGRDLESVVTAAANTAAYAFGRNALLAEQPPQQAGSSPAPRASAHEMPPTGNLFNISGGCGSHAQEHSGLPSRPSSRQPAASDPSDPSRPLSVLPLIDTERAFPTPQPIQQQQSRLPGSDYLGGAGGLPLQGCKSLVPACPGRPPMADLGPSLESHPSFTGNNDELIAAMAAAGLGPKVPSAATPTCPVEGAEGRPAAAMAVAAAAAAAVAGVPAITADVAGAMIASPASAAGIGGAGRAATSAAAAVAVPARPQDVTSGPKTEVVFTGRPQLQPQPPSSGGPGPRQRRYEAHGARGSSSGMAEFPDEAALAAIAGAVASFASSVSGSAPGTPPVSPHGNPTRPPQPWSASSSARSLQSYNISPPPQQQQQTQQLQTQTQQLQQQVPNPWPTPPSSYNYTPSPSPGPSSSSQFRQQRTPSAGDHMELAVPTASATPAISVADGIAIAPTPADTGVGPAARPLATEHPASPFALVAPNRSLVFGSGNGGSLGGGALGGVTSAAGVTVGVGVDGGRTSADSNRRIESQAVPNATANNQNQNHDRIYSHPLTSIYSRDTFSGALSSAECSSGGAARFSLAGVNGGQPVPLAGLSRGLSVSGGEGSISGCGLSALTLGNSTGAGSIGCAGSGSIGTAAPHKRLRAPPATASHLTAVGSAGTSLTAEEDCGGSSGGEGDDGNATTATANKIWKPEDLPAPVAVLVTGLSREVGEDGRRRRVTVHGLFHADRYLANQDCIYYENKFISRSAFEKAGGSTTAKWHCSIKVAGTQSVTLGNWLSSKGLPVLKGGSRKSKRQRAVERSGVPLGNSPLLMQLTAQQPQPQPPLRLSMGGSLSGALPPNVPAAASGSPRNSVGSVAAGVSGACAMSGVSLAVWPHPQPQPQQQQPPQPHPPSQSQQPLPSVRQQMSQSQQVLPYLHPQPQPQPLSHRHMHHNHPPGAVRTGGTATGQRLPICPPVTVPQTPLQPLQQQTTPSPSGGVPLPPMPSPPHSGQVYPPSVFHLAQLSSPAAGMAAPTPTPTPSGGGAGGFVRSMSLAGPDGRPFSCPVGISRAESGVNCLGAAPMSAPQPGSNAYQHQHQMSSQFAAGGNGLGGGGGGSGGGAPVVTGADRVLYGTSNAGLFGFGHPRSTSGGASPPVEVSGSASGSAARVASLPPLYMLPPLQPQGR